jgi:AsmA protein
MPGYRYPGGNGPGPYEPSRRASPPRAPKTPPVLLGLIYGGIALLAVAVGAVTFVLMAPPTDLIRRQVVAGVKQATGRDLVIAGPASFTFFPTLGLRVSDVTLSPPPGMGGAPFLTAQSIDVGVRLLPLLRQEIAVDRLVLNHPVFDLRVDAQGRRSWDMAALRLRDRLRFARSQKTIPLVAAGFSGSGARSGDISAISLGNIRIVDGTVRYLDQRFGRSALFESIDATADLPAASQPLNANGSFGWNGEKVAFDGSLTSLQTLLQDRRAQLKVNATSRPGNASYDGSITIADAADAQGAIKADTPSLRAFARWLGAKLPRARGFGPASIAGNLDAKGRILRLSGASISLDGATATGTLTVDTSGVRPHVDAKLKVAGLNFANYTASGAGAAPEPVSASPPAQADPQSPSAGRHFAPDSIEDLLERPDPSGGPQVRGFTQRTGWSTRPMEIAALGAADVDAEIAAERLRFGGIKIDAAALTVALKDEVLDARFTNVRMYSGRGNGVVAVDARSGEARLSTDVALAGIAAAPLLKDASGIDWLAGTGDLTFALKGHGTSEAAIVSTLDGRANIAVHNGAIIGFNVGAALRSVSEGRIPNFAPSSSEKTDFSQLTGSFVVAEGIARNDDLRLSSPLLRATGAGTVDLPQRQLDYTMRPKLVASAAGQGGEQNLAGLEIPVHIVGPWEDPDIKPDISGVINNPEAVNAVKQIGKELKGKNAGEIVEDLFGKKNDGEPSKAEKLLQKFLGR